MNRSRATFLKKRIAKRVRLAPVRRRLPKLSSPAGSKASMADDWGDHGIFMPQIAHFGKPVAWWPVDPSRPWGAPATRAEPEYKQPWGGVSRTMSPGNVVPNWDLQSPIVIGPTASAALVVLELCGRFIRNSPQAW